MPNLTGRVEKHQGFTLMVDAKQKWMDVVSSEGYQFSGPVTQDADVLILAAIAIPILQQCDILKLSKA